MVLAYGRIYWQHALQERRNRANMNGRRSNLPQMNADYGRGNYRISIQHIIV